MYSFSLGVFPYDINDLYDQRCVWRCTYVVKVVYVVALSSCDPSLCRTPAGFIRCTSHQTSLFEQNQSVVHAVGALVAPEEVPDPRNDTGDSRRRIFTRCTPTVAQASGATMTLSSSIRAPLWLSAPFISAKYDFTLGNSTLATSSMPRVIARTSEK
jgi:hypothetical protein